MLWHRCKGEREPDSRRIIRSIRICQSLKLLSPLCYRRTLLIRSPPSYGRQKSIYLKITPQRIRTTSSVSKLRLLKKFPQWNGQGPSPALVRDTTTASPRAILNIVLLSSKLSDKYTLWYVSPSSFYVFETQIKSQLSSFHVNLPLILLSWSINTLKTSNKLVSRGHGKPSTHPRFIGIGIGLDLTWSIIDIRIAWCPCRGLALPISQKLRHCVIRSSRRSSPVIRKKTLKCVKHVKPKPDCIEHLQNNSTRSSCGWETTRRYHGRPS